MPADASALILDGGTATRLGGCHKAFLVVDGEPIAHRTVRLLRGLATEVIASTSRPDPWRALGVPTVADEVAGAGPIAGLAAGLAACSRPTCLVVAGDMPHLSADVLGFLLGLAEAHPGAAVVPVRGGRAEPLHAAWPTAAAAPARAALHRGVRKLTDLLASLPVRWVPAEELAPLPGAGRSFDNVNAPEDLPGHARDDHGT